MESPHPPPPPSLKGRGAQSQVANRYLQIHLEEDLGHLEHDPELAAQRDRPPTRYLEDQSQSIVATNDSPDIAFNYSLNPYRGCLHGCSYCYARPTHEYLGLSAGLDFETTIFVKPRAAELFRQWLARPQWQPEFISLSGVTDPYQPVERQLELTRQCLAVAAECRQPIGIVTKNAMVTRDIDLLKQLAEVDAVAVAISITTLDEELARTIEPRTSSPSARLRAISQLAAAGIPTHVMVAPVIPGLTDWQMPGILKAAREAGATSAAYVLLRLPTTVEPVFFGWLERYYPNHREKIENLLRSTRGGKVYRGEFGKRMRGEGEVAQQVANTFALFRKKLGYAEERQPLNASAFRPPQLPGAQMRLF